MHFFLDKHNSNNLGCEDSIKELFNPKISNKKTECFELNCQKVEVEGEIDKTEYLFIEARRKTC